VYSNFFELNYINRIIQIESRKIALEILLNRLSIINSLLFYLCLRLSRYTHPPPHRSTDTGGYSDSSGTFGMTVTLSHSTALFIYSVSLFKLCL
jgi:hypothetical protein